MGKDRDFPFCIEQVISLLPINIRRPVNDGVYTDCPFCGDCRGKLKINYELNTWRCNYCGEGGGMLSLYSRLNGNISNHEAFEEICDKLIYRDDFDTETAPLITDTIKREKSVKKKLEIPTVHKSLSGMLGMLTLSEQHREHLRTVRGLTDEQIDRIGFKSTPPFYKGKVIAKRLLNAGLQVDGVPGFYTKNGIWTAAFSSYTQGILIPVRGIDGLIHGIQIRLDVPLKNKDGTDGAKYIWFSSQSKENGTSSGSPVQFIGNIKAKKVFFTEGYLKSYIAHCLTGKSFVAISGANNTAGIDEIISSLTENGTEEIVDAMDIDKFRNPLVADGVNKIREIAEIYGLRFTSLIWNPNFKGIDDWCIHKRNHPRKEDNLTNLKDRFTTQNNIQRYRIYQLDCSPGCKVRPFAFAGFEKLINAGLTQPPAAEYNLVCDDFLRYGDNEDDNAILRLIKNYYGEYLPENYLGRTVAPSDVIELYSGGTRRYFYCDENGFMPTRFSPMMAKSILKETKE